MTITMIDISRRWRREFRLNPPTGPSHEVSWSKEQSGSVNVGKLTMNIHTGTHIDSPFHFDNEWRPLAASDRFMDESKRVPYGNRLFARRR